MPEQNVYFCETQKFSPWLRWVLVLDMAFLMGILLLFFVFMEKEQKAAIPILPFAAVCIVPIVILLFVCWIRMETRVGSDGLYVRFFPLHVRFQKFSFEQIADYYARQYKPVAEYGGWGIKYSLSSGKAYNIRGNQGVQLVFKDGRKLLIGSQVPEQMVAALDSVITR